MMEKEKCLFLKNHPCEKDFCENCPVYYDWAVYKIHNANKEEDECSFVGGPCL